MSNLKKEIIEKIKSGEVRKKPFWYFLTKKYVIWFSFVFSVISGALSFSIFLLHYFDTFGPWYQLKSSVNFFFSEIFLIWIFSAILFIFLTIFNFRKIKNIFKYRLIYIILFNFLLIIILGCIFYKIDIGTKLDYLLSQKSLKYYSLKESKKNYILNILKQENINPQEFFSHNKIIQLENKYSQIDVERIKKIEYILKSLKGKIDSKQLNLLNQKIENIKKQKDKINILRLEKELEIYQNMVK